MADTTKHWNLGIKLMLVGVPFLLLILLSTAATLWVSSKLDGGAAAVNEAGRMRMQSYRMSLSIGTQVIDQLPSQINEFNQSLMTLRHGDVDRPLFVPWDEAVSRQFALVEAGWHSYQERWITSHPKNFSELRSDTVQFESDIDAFVSSIEAYTTRWTGLLHILQLSLFGLVVLAAVVLLYTGYMFVLEPVGLLKQAIEKIQLGNFEARVERTSSDEFGTLADGFNGMAAHLQSMYKNLEAKVVEKTAQLQEKSERLESLYEVTALIGNTTTLDALAKGFVQSLARTTHADGVALRWSSQGNQRHLLLATHGLPAALVEAERCIYSGECYCGAITTRNHINVIAIRDIKESMPRHCAKAGFETLVTIPVRQHERLMGEADLFFKVPTTLSPSDLSLLEALSCHLASGMENLRLNALEMEAAVSQERNFLARELHDSIAQSLAFLKIQVQLMRDAVKLSNPDEIQRVLEEIDLGVRESYGDVRELLMHFRTRANTEDIESALITTLKKFEHQSQVKAELTMHGEGMPLSPDVQIQVLHIIQEALSNVRKHANASQVWLTVQQQPAWRFEVRDNGVGFDAGQDKLDETHVGIRIMSERAQRIGADLSINSKRRQGCTVALTLPVTVRSGSSDSVDLAETVTQSSLGGTSL